MNIRTMQQDAWKCAEEHGWHEKQLNVPEKLALIHSEVSEALEDFREGRMQESFVEGKPCGFASEMADILIRVGDLCGILGIDLQEAVETKMAYNATRPYRHGGKHA
jgi:NTP pyrophosphatase (non-canonical NTP hydrolase)